VDGIAAPGELPGIAVVPLPAVIDLDSAAQVRAALTGALATGITVLIADMTATTCCTLEGVAALWHARRAAEAAGAQLRLAAVCLAVRRKLEIIAIDQLLGIYPSLDAARDGQAR
jgi:anti-sigma B factor antagonist